jgi:hypothetical protein
VIKQFFPSAQGTGTLQKAAELFKEEAIRLDSLGRYPQIPELYAYFTGNDGRQYLVQEYKETITNALCDYYRKSRKQLFCLCP